jgi:hypothetical protein
MINCIGRWRRRGCMGDADESVGIVIQSATWCQGAHYLIESITTNLDLDTAGSRVPIEVAAP